MWFHVLCYQILRLEEFLVNCGGGYKNIVFIILHKILCGKEFKRYGLFNKNGIEVSYCYQMTKNLRFPYMEKNTLQFGPCFTQKEYRGNGFYPLMLNYLMCKQVDMYKVFYIFCCDDNTALMRGISKAGFSLFGKGKKKFCKYIITEYLCKENKL